ncbi:hypothetical protein GCM10019017_25710 [Streptomyces showdoensis]
MAARGRWHDRDREEPVPSDKDGTGFLSGTCSCRSGYALVVNKAPDCPPEIDGKAPPRTPSYSLQTRHPSERAQERSCPQPAGRRRS